MEFQAFASDRSVANQSGATDNSPARGKVSHSEWQAPGRKVSLPSSTGLLSISQHAEDRSVTMPRTPDILHQGRFSLPCTSAVSAPTPTAFRIVRAVLFLGLALAGAAKVVRSGQAASGSLGVTAIVQSSIQLIARSTQGGELVAGGDQGATVAIPIVARGHDSEPEHIHEDIRLTTISRIAAFPDSRGYTLEATWLRGGDCTLKIDGIAVAPNLFTDITQSKVLGDPYATETQRRILVSAPAGNARQSCLGTLVLTARPKI